MFELGVNIEDKVSLDGVYHTLNAIDVEGDAVSLVLKADDNTITISPNEFRSLYGQNRLALSDPLAHPADLQPHAGGAETTKALVRLFYCQAFDKDPVKLSDEKLDGFIARTAPLCPYAHKPPSAGALRVWVRSRGEPGRRLIRYMHDRQVRGPKGSGLNDEVEAIISAELEAHFQDIRRTDRTTVELVWAAVQERNAIKQQEDLALLDLPSESSIRRRIKAGRTRENVAAKWGRHISEQAFDGLRGSVEASRPLETVVIDHTELDLHLIDEETGLTWGRPTLCIAIDVATRAIISFWLSVRAPSIETLTGLMRWCVRPKDDWLARHEGLVGEWPMFGCPRKLVIDNGIEGVGPSFKSSCEAHGIEAHYAPVGTPDYKGICERAIQTVNGFVKELDGGVFDGVEAMRKLRVDASSDAVLTLQQAERFLTDWLINYYHRRPHAGLKGRTPLATWADLAKKSYIPLVPDLDQFDSALGHRVERCLSKQGVRVDNLNYSGPAVSDLLRDLLPTQTSTEPVAHSVKVQVRVMPDDISVIHVFNPRRQCFVALRCEYQTYSRFLSRSLHQEIQKAAAADKNVVHTEHELAKVKTRILKEVEAQKNSNKRTLRRKSRLAKESVPSGRKDGPEVSRHAVDLTHCREEFPPSDEWRPQISF